MRKSVLLFVLFIIAGFLSAQVKYSEVKIHTDKPGMIRLAALGLAMDDGALLKDGCWHSIVPATDVEKARKAGFAVDVILDDYTTAIGGRNKALIPEIEAINRQIRDHSLKTTYVSDYPVPQNFTLGTMGGFCNLQEVMNQLDSMAVKYPTLITQRAPASTAVTVEGRSLYFVKISKNANVNENEPKVFYNALIHAREPQGMQQLLFYMWYLLENYNTNEEVRYLLDHLELYFIPVINPDGYEYNHSIAPTGGGAWRKNRKANTGGTFGVDLNRNFGYQWGYDNVGSSPTPTDETFRGTAAFSEQETQIVRDFCVQHNFIEALNYHTYSNLFLYPWSYITSDTPDSNYFLNYAEIMTRQNRYLTGTPGAVLYNTNGDSNDWMYGEQSLKPKVYCYTPETGNDLDNFWPLPDRIIPLCQENMYQNLMMAHLALRYAETKDISPAIQPEKQGYLKYEFRKYGLEPTGNYTVSIEPIDPAQIFQLGAPKVYNLPAQFLKITDSISCTLASSVDVGAKFQYVLKIDNGWYTFRDTVTKYYGPPLVAFTDNCNAFTNWTSNKWNVSHTVYSSPNGSITDSPSGNYTSNSNYAVNLDNSIDLKDSPVAMINYMARWYLEPTYDYVEFKTTLDGGTTYIPMKGRYTKNGSGNQDPGKPLYDGRNNAWYPEEVMMENTQNKHLIPEFQLVSDAGTNYDGFYFDDFTVTIIDMTSAGVRNKTTNENSVSAFPNPASESVTFSFNAKGTGNSLELSSGDGRVICEMPLSGTAGEFRYSLAGLAEGVYFYRLKTSSGSTGMKKLIVIR